jgi:hypothetical protein
MNYISGYQSSMPSGGQSVNKGNILAGLNAESAYKPNTGTATGDRAAKDLAKSSLFAARATVGRGADKQNAKVHMERQQQKEQLTQQGRAARMQRYQQDSQQAVSQMDLAARLRQGQIDMQNQWQLGLLGLLR